MELALLFLFGLVGGSFLNVLVYRLNVSGAPKFWQGRSFCPSCQKTIAWYDNIPLLSFVRLRGKCRHCHQKISWQYPVVELVTAVAFVLAWWLAPTQLGALGKLGLLGVVASFIVIFFSDSLYGLIPDEMIVTGSLLAIIFNYKFVRFSSEEIPRSALFSIFNQFLISNLLTGVLSGLGFLLVVVVTKFRGMGLGDVKLAFLIGLLLGWRLALVAFWSAFLVGGIVAVFLLLLRKTTISARIALGPFLILGVLFSALWGEVLWHAVIP